MNAVVKALNKTDRMLELIMRWICLFCAAALLVLLAMNVAARFLHINSFPWLDEVVEWAFAWLVFFGAAALWQKNDHFRIDWIVLKLRGKPFGKIYALILDLLSLFFFVVMSYFAIVHTKRATQLTPILNISKRYLFICIPVSAVLMAVYALRNACVNILALFGKNMAGGRK